MSLRPKIVAYRNREFCLENAVEAYLKRIKQRASLNAFIHLSESSARRSARQMDALRKKGNELPPLAGIILAVKDNIHIKNQPTTCSSKILDSFVSPFSATAVQRLQQAGALFIGKTNLDEFAMGSSGAFSAFGPTLHPFLKDKLPGGSSSGSAAAVAAKLCDAALGSDTGGSVRQPAAYTNLVGLKPSYGRVSRYGLVAFASSLDQIGLLTHSVRDSALLLKYMAGFDSADATSAAVSVPDYLNSVTASVKEMRVGILDDFPDKQVRMQFEDLAVKIKAAGASVRPVKLSLLEYAVAVYYIIASAEASSNLSRYDGVRYGNRVPQAGTLSRMYRQTRSRGFGEEVQRRILLGTYVLSGGYYEAYYEKAQKVRRLILNELNQAFKQVDVILSPTVSGPPFGTNQEADPLEMYQSDRYTIPASLSGICALHVPFTAGHPERPWGVQIMAPAFKEARLFRVGSALEKMALEVARA